MLEVVSCFPRTCLISVYGTVPFWQRFGFKVKHNGAPFGFSGHTFVEMVDESDPPDTAISIDDGPYKLIRPEGQWSYPGILDRSGRNPWL